MRRTIEEIVILTSKDANQPSRDVYFLEVRQDLGEVELMAIGPLRQSYMGAPLGMLKCNAEFSSARNEEKKLLVLSGELQIYWEAHARSIELVREREVTKV